MPRRTLARGKNQLPAVRRVFGDAQSSVEKGLHHRPQQQALVGARHRATLLKSQSPPNTAASLTQPLVAVFARRQNHRRGVAVKQFRLQQRYIVCAFS